METVAISYCMPFPRSLPPGSVEPGSRHQAHEHAVKLLHIEIELDFDALSSRMLFIVGRPGQRVAIAPAPVEIYGHIAALGACDDAYEARAREKRSSSGGGGVASGVMR